MVPLERKACARGAGPALGASPSPILPSLASRRGSATIQQYQICTTGCIASRDPHLALGDRPSVRVGAGGPIVSLASPPGTSSSSATSEALRPRRFSAPVIARLLRSTTTVQELADLVAQQAPYLDTSHVGIAMLHLALLASRAEQQQQKLQQVQALELQRAQQQGGDEAGGSGRTAGAVSSSGSGGGRSGGGGGVGTGMGAARALALPQSSLSSMSSMDEEGLLQLSAILDDDEDSTDAEEGGTGAAAAAAAAAPATVLAATAAVAGGSMSGSTLGKQEASAALNGGATAAAYSSSVSAASAVPSARDATVAAAASAASAASPSAAAASPPAAASSAIGGPTPAATRALRTLLSRVFAQLDSLTGPQLSAVFAGLAVLRYSDKTVGQQLLQALALKLYECRPQELSNVLASAALLGLPPDPDVRTAFYAAARTKARSFEPRELAAVLWAYGAIGTDVQEDAVQLILEQSRPKLGSFTPLQLAKVAQGLAALRYRPTPEWVEAYCAALRPALRRMGSRELCAVLLALASLQVGLDPTTRAALLVHTFTVPLPSMAPPEAAAAIWALGRLTALDMDLPALIDLDMSGRVLDLTAGQLASGGFSAGELQQLLEGLTRLALQPPLEWMQAFVTALQPQLGSLDAQQLAGVLNSLAAQQYRPQPEMQEVVLAATQANMTQLLADTTCSAALITALRRLNIEPPPGWVGALLEASRSALKNRCTDLHLANLAGSLAAWGVKPDGRWAARMMWRAQVLMKEDRMSPRALVALLQAMVSLGLRPNPGWTSLCLRSAASRASQPAFEPHHYGTLMASLHALGVQPSQEWQTRMLLSTYRCWDRLSVTHWSSLLPALVLLKARPPREWLRRFEATSAARLADCSALQLLTLAVSLAQLHQLAASGAVTHTPVVTLPPPPPAPPAAAATVATVAAAASLPPPAAAAVDSTSAATASVLEAAAPAAAPPLFADFGSAAGGAMLAGGGQFSSFISVDDDGTAAVAAAATKFTRAPPTVTTTTTTTTTTTSAATTSSPSDPSSLPPPPSPSSFPPSPSGLLPGSPWLSAWWAASTRLLLRVRYAPSELVLTAGWLASLGLRPPPEWLQACADVAGRYSKVMDVAERQQLAAAVAPLAGARVGGGGVVAAAEAAQQPSRS